MSVGSGLFSNKTSVREHLLRNQGLPKEIKDLREDVAATLSPMANLVIEEFTDAPAADDDGLLLIRTGLNAADNVFEGSDLDGVVYSGPMDGVLKYPRNVTFTTAQADGKYTFPLTVTITGTDVNGAALTEDITLQVGASPGTATGVKMFKTVTKIEVPQQAAADADIIVGFGDLLGLSYTPKSRAGLVAPIREIAAGSAVTNGVFDATNKSYAPNAPPDGTKDYAVYYEAVPA